jgi:hypothetical protein
MRRSIARYRIMHQQTKSMLALDPKSMALDVNTTSPTVVQSINASLARSPTYLCDVRHVTGSRNYTIRSFSNGDFSTATYLDVGDPGAVPAWLGNACWCVPGRHVLRDASQTWTIAKASSSAWTITNSQVQCMLAVLGGAVLTRSALPSGPDASQLWEFRPVTRTISSGEITELSFSNLTDMVL